MASRSNEEWLAALTEPSGQAQAEALEELRDYLLRAALVYLAHRRSDLSDWSRQSVRDLAQDLAQESLIDIRKNLDRFRGDSQFTTWAFRFVINRAASELRRQHYRDLSLDRLQEEAAALFESLLRGREPASGRDAEQLVVRRYYLGLLNEIISTELTERQRAAVVWVYLEGRSMDEVAAALKLNRNALYKLLHDARKRIKDRLLARHLSQGDILAAFEN